MSPTNNARNHEKVFAESLVSALRVEVAFLERMQDQIPQKQRVSYLSGILKLKTGADTLSSNLNRYQTPNKQHELREVTHKFILGYERCRMMGKRLHDKLPKVRGQIYKDLTRD